MSEQKKKEKNQIQMFKKIFECHEMTYLYKRCEAFSQTLNIS